MSEVNDRELLVRTIDMLHAVSASRFESITLPTDDAIAKGPTVVYTTETVDKAVGALRSALATESETMRVAAIVRGGIGSLLKLIA